MGRKIRKTQLAMLGVVVCCALATGCTTDENATQATPTAQTSTAPAVKVAPGTLPPTGEPQPGDAPLTEDGYYDYDDPDFTPGEPCSPEILARAEKEGFIPTGLKEDWDQISRSRSCMLGKTDGFESLVISVGTRGLLSLREAEVEYDTIDINGKTVYLENEQHVRNIADCTARIDTPKGSYGLTRFWGDLGDFRTAEEACMSASQKLDDYILGDFE
ncbi:DUF3558 domain-containing protein [Corynebacterium sp. TAE3-ERU12]|uniref:DUF3558 domain-containing protein n=1 Tax=Corynebacterium sp. TAE3-ERU12 TaxID=2849491 RepID=UPI001C463772|nr:DUF3558 domain-containing protein [Corynebacterium sp. TAE3-ERU12]MBV7295081.1 DUF3558 domain-containing protein [Corynebacterium sp. TAE3-ERU12]